MAMRLTMWILTVMFALAGLAVWGDHSLLGADRLAQGLFALALLACPFVWARTCGLLPETLVIPGKTRLMMALTVLVAAPLLLPWQYWL